MPRKSNSHWVTDAKATHCAHADCGKMFSWTVRKHHCRMCGLVFCDTHSSRRMRLDEEHKPSATGELVRVCDSCSVLEHQTAEEAKPAASSASVALKLHVAGEVVRRDRTLLFTEIRAASNREKMSATTPLVEAYAALRDQAGSKKPAGPLGGSKKVAWKGPSDANATSCSVCHRGFTQFVRRHHCRLCAKVVCENCSAHRKAAASDGAFVYRSCHSCDGLLERHERAAEFARLRQAAAQSPFARAFTALSAASKTVREEIATFEAQVSILGTPAATSRTAFDDAYATQKRLDDSLMSHVDSFKKFMALPAAAHEAASKEAVKRQLDVLRLESFPRFHALKRQLEKKAEMKSSLDEYLLAKRSLIELSRSSMLYAKPQLVDVAGLLELKRMHLQHVLLEINQELDVHAEALNLDPSEQLRELTAAITAPRNTDLPIDNATKEQLLSRLLHVATSACSTMDDSVPAYHFAAARHALHGLRDGLKEIYMNECIPY